jgi:predicted nucleic acid-binding protein
MMAILVDSNVLLDIFTKDPVWFQWSSDALASRESSDNFVINPVIYSEVSIGFQRMSDLEAVLPLERFRREKLPWEAAFLAGKCFLEYRRRGGAKRSPLPDFFIGAHASVMNWFLMTRDAARYRTYFPELMLISPELV